MKTIRAFVTFVCCFFLIIGPSTSLASGPKGGHGKKVKIEAHKTHIEIAKAHIKIKTEICRSTCSVVAKLSVHSEFEHHDKHKDKHKKDKSPKFLTYAVDWGDGSPIEYVTANTAYHDYTVFTNNSPENKKGKGHHLGRHKKKDEVKIFRPSVVAIFEGDLRSKPDFEKVRVIAEYRESPPENMAPVARLSVTPNEGLAPLQVTLDASGSSDDKGIVLYTFIVGNGEIISTTEPVLNVVYSSANVFNPQVVVKDQEGLESSIGASVSVSAPPVNQAPIASLSATPLLGDAPLLVTFDSSASSDDHAIVSRAFIFGDGQSLTTTEAVVTHLYQQSGNYTASVEIFDQENLSSTESVAIEVNTPNTAPIARLSVDKIRANPGASFKFDGSASTDAENNIVSYSLSNSVLGINQTNTTGIFDVVINQSGSFDFILEVTDSMNLKSSANVSISVNVPPIALLSADKISGEAPLTVTFDSSASSDDVGIIKRDYQFAPNVFALNAGSTVSYTYNEPGVFPAKIQIYDGENLVSEATVEITVTAPEIRTPPIAWFQIEADPSTGLVRLKNQAIAGSSNIISVSYLVNNQVSLSSAIYAYSEASFQAEGGLRYDIKQIVTDEQNQTSEETISVVMDETQQAPVPQFTIAQSNINQVFLNALYSFDLLNSTTSMKINWGDQTPEETLLSHFASHNYQNAGTYSVTLTLENAQNITNSLTREITVTNSAPEALSPIANFSAIYDEGAKHVRLFSEYSASPNGEILSYFWEYGDGQVGYGQQSLHFYSVGMYLTRLTVTDSMGIRASQVQQIIITENGPPIISGVDCRSFGLYGECDFFAAHKDKQLDRVDVNWGDGSIDSYPVENNEWQTFDAIGHFYQSAGTYDVTIHAITFLGEESVSNAQIVAEGDSGENHPPVANLSCSVVEYTQVQCDTLGSFDNDGFIQSYDIDMGDGVTYSDSYAFHTYAESGNYLATLTIVDNLGAVSIAQTTLVVLKRVNEAPIAKLNCLSPSVNLIQCNAEGSFDDLEIVSFEYHFSDGEVVSTRLSSDVVSKTFQDSSEQLITLKLKDSDEATSETSLTIIPIINQVPYVSFECVSETPFHVHCEDMGSQDSDGQIVAMKWYVDGTLVSNSNQFDFDFENFPLNAIVKLEVIDNFQLIASLEKSIDVKQSNPPELLISCNEIKNLLLSCQPSYYNQFAQPVSYKWIVNGIQYDTEKISIQYETAIDAIISLEIVSDRNEISNDSLVFSVQDDGSGVGNSTAAVQLEGIIVQGLNPVLTEFSFKLLNGNVDLDLNGKPSYLQVKLNNDFVDSEKIEFIGDSILVKEAMAEGKNYLSLIFKDSLGNRFENDWEFISGSNNVSLAVTSPTGENLTGAEIVLVLKEYPEYQFKQANYQFNNIPTGNAVFYVKSSAFFGITARTINGNLSTLEVVANSNLAMASVPPLEIDASTNNWKNLKGPISHDIHNPEDSIIKYPDGVLNTSIQYDDNGEILALNKFIFSESEDRISIPIKTSGIDINATSVAIIENPISNELDFHFFDNSDIEFNLNFGANTGEERNIVLYSLIRNSATVESPPFSILDIFIEKAWAATGSSASGLLILPIVEDFFGEVNIQNQVDGSLLGGISTGNYPNVGPTLARIYRKPSSYILNTEEFINPLQLSFDVNSKIKYFSRPNTKLIFQVLTPNYSVAFEKEITISLSPFLQKFFLESGDIPPSFDYFRLRLVARDSVDESQLLGFVDLNPDPRIAVTRGLFPTMRSIYNVPDVNIFEFKYGTNANLDPEQGYDGWFWSGLESELSYLSTIYRVQIGDLSGINGMTLPTGKGTQRKGHFAGTDVDIKVLGTNSWDTSPHVGEESEGSAYTILSLLNYLPYGSVRVYGATTGESNKSLQFDAAKQSSCLFDGRRLSTVVRNWSNHKDHHHISFYGAEHRKPTNFVDINDYSQNTDYKIEWNRVLPNVSSEDAHYEVISVQGEKRIFYVTTYPGLKKTDELYLHYSKAEETINDRRWIKIEPNDVVYVNNENLYISTHEELLQSKYGVYPLVKIVRTNGDHCFDNIIGGANFPPPEITSIGYSMSRFVNLDNGQFRTFGGVLSVFNSILDKAVPAFEYTKEYTGDVNVKVWNDEHLLHGLKSNKMKFRIQISPRSNPNSISTIDFYSVSEFHTALRTKNLTPGSYETKFIQFYEDTGEEIRYHFSSFEMQECLSRNNQRWDNALEGCVEQ